MDSCCCWFGKGAGCVDAANADGQRQSIPGAQINGKPRCSPSEQPEVVIAAMQRVRRVARGGLVDEGRRSVHGCCIMRRCIPARDAGGQGRGDWGSPILTWGTTTTTTTVCRTVFDRDRARAPVVSTRRDEVCLVGMHARRARILVAKVRAAVRPHLGFTLGPIAHEAFGDARASPDVSARLYQSVSMRHNTGSALLGSTLITAACRVHRMLTSGRQRLGTGGRAGAVELEGVAVEEELFLRGEW